MRKYILIALSVLGVLALIIAPTALMGQFGGNKFGGPGGPGGFMSDPKSQFDRYAKGRPYFLISDTRYLGAELLQYAQQKGITNGQITLPQFLEFAEQRKAKVASGE